MRKSVLRRRARLLREKQAVSPVVATLILILVAVAAAAALYLWLVAWQGGVTKTVGTPGAQYTIAIGGSTTVFPVTAQAIPWFEANNSGVVVANNAGGSGAGELSLCAGTGAIDIAAMSRPMKSAELALCPTAVQTIIGYDAVTATVTAATTGATTNQAGIVSWGEGELLNIFWQNGGQPSTAAGFPSTLGGSTAVLVGSGSVPAANVPANWGLMSPTGTCAGTPNNCYTWAQIPQVACYDATNVAGLAVPADVTANGYLTPAGLIAYDALGTAVCKTAWSYTATVGVSTAIPTLYTREDNGGTSEAFDNNILGISCGTDNQLDSCGFTYSANTHNTAVLNVAIGNPLVLALGLADKNAIITGSWGLSSAPTAKGGGAAGTPQAVAATPAYVGNGQVVSTVDCAAGHAASTAGAVACGAVIPTLNNVKTGIAAGYGVQVAGGYAGWRPLQYVTLGTPTGEPLRFIDFVLQPNNNELLLEDNFYISIDQ